MTGIIIPVYNALKYLPNALDSLISQTDKDFQIFLSIDGDKKDKDYICIKKFYERLGLNITLIHSDINGGPGIARQRGIDVAANCEYLIFLDADDMLMPRAVEVLTREMKSHEADIAAADFIQETQEGDGNIIHCINAPITWMHGKCYRRQYLIDKNICFLPEFRFNEDSYFNMVAWHSTEKKIKIQEPLYLWKNNSESLTRSAQGKELFEKIMETYINTQIFALLKIIENTGKINTLIFAGTIHNIYKYIMKQRFYKIDQNNYIENFKLLLNNDIIQSKFDDFEFWNYFITSVPQGEIINDTLFFYKQNIKDFLDEWIIKRKD